MDTKTEQKVKRAFKNDPRVKVAYFFGSRARRKEGPMSDYDFAVYLGERDARKAFDAKSALESKLASALGTDKVEVVVLDTTENPALKYQIIREGKVLAAREPFKVLVEPRILNEYFDFRSQLRRHRLTRT